MGLGLLMGTPESAWEEARGSLPEKFVLPVEPDEFDRREVEA
jgi:hypothetical protein